MNKKYFFGPNSPAGRQGQEKVGEKRRIEKKKLTVKQRHYNFMTIFLKSR